ncbi:unnamed protein product [Arabidopsis thaliana]|uniref:SURP motif domain-containing protein n=1 Tax=Arabidopsis thaliana TaxID=3702 RepID=A0A654FYX6_ARATH|nr:unnamed protein product [Arabidopsis thaliana]
MYTSMHKDLRSRQNNSNQVGADSESTRLVNIRNLAKIVNDSRFRSLSPDTPATHDAQDYLWPPSLDMPLLAPPVNFSHLPLGITFTRKELELIKLTAQFVAVYGKYFQRELTTRVVESPLFEFLKPTDSRNSFYTRIILGYQGVLMPSQKLKTKSEVFDGFSKLIAQVPVKDEDDVEMAMTDLHAYEYFANMSINDLRAPAPVKFAFLTRGVTFTRNELDTIKLTAQFVAVYGTLFRTELMKRVFISPKFDFLKSTDSKCSFYLRLVDGYSRVLRRSRKNGAGLGEVVVGFLKLLDQVVEKKDAVEMALTDLHALEFFANVDGGVLQPRPEQYHPMMPTVPPLIMPQLGSQFTQLQVPQPSCSPPVRMMSPPRPQNDLQSGQSNSNKAPASVAPIEPPPEIRSCVENTALIVSKNGLEIERKMMELSMNDARHRFVWSTDPYHAFYQLKLAEYRAQNQDRAHDIQPNVLRSFGFGFEFPEKEITLKELGIIKLTAQFMARYGMNFVQGLRKRVVGNPQFKFLESTNNSRFSFYNGLVIAYSRVLMPSKMLSKSDDCTAIVVDGFLSCLQLEKREEGVDIDMIDLLDCFARLEDADYSANVPQPQHLSTQMQPPHTPETSPPLPLPLKNESSPVLADQHPDSSTIDDEWQVIDFTGQSLPDNVASLKDKTAGGIQIPANK